MTTDHSLSTSFQRDGIWHLQHIKSKRLTFRQPLFSEMEFGICSTFVSESGLQFVNEFSARWNLTFATHSLLKADHSLSTSFQRDGTWHLQHIRQWKRITVCQGVFSEMEPDICSTFVTESGSQFVNEFSARWNLTSATHSFVKADHNLSTSFQRAGTWHLQHIR